MSRSQSEKMSIRVIVCLSFLVLVLGHEIPIDEEHHKIVMRCSKENDLTDEEVHDFAKDLKEPTPEIKNFFLCLSQSLGVFDGTNWNREKIKKVAKDENKLAAVEECLAKDDKNLEPRERNFVVVACTLEKEAFV